MAGTGSFNMELDNSMAELLSTGSDMDNGNSSDLSDTELNAIVQGVKPKATVNQTIFGVRKFTDWITRRKTLEISLETSSPEDLAKAMRKFYLEMRNKDGKLPSPSTLRGVRAALHRHITGPRLNRTINIMNDTAFLQANQAFNAACKRFHQSGGAKPVHKPTISKGDLEKIGMYSRDYMANPVKLQEVMWFLITLNFGRRGREGFREMTKNTFRVGRDENGRYLYQASLERTKNHQGGSRATNSDFETVKAYESNGTTSVVDVFEYYIGRLSANPQFFQKPKQTVIAQDKEWYQNAPLGVHTLDQMMPRISLHAGLGSRYTNHSVRATTITSLARANIGEKAILSITKQKNPQTLQHYLAEPEDSEKQRCSAVLSSILGAPESSNSITFEYEAISDEDLSQAYTRAMATSNISMPPIVIQPGAVLNNCTFNFNMR